MPADDKSEEQRVVLASYTNTSIITHSNTQNKITICYCNNHYEGTEKEAQKNVIVWYCRSNKRRHICVSMPCFARVGIPSFCGDEDIQAATKEHHEDHQDITAPTQNAGHAHTHSHHIHKHIWILLFSCELWMYWECILHRCPTFHIQNNTCTKSRKRKGSINLTGIAITIRCNKAWCALTRSQAHHTLNMFRLLVALGQRTLLQKRIFKWIPFIKGPLKLR